MSTIVTAGNTQAGSALTTVGLILAATLIITACSIGLYTTHKCQQSELQPTTVKNLRTTLWVGVGLGGFLALGAILFALMNRPK
jgi:F0F1-type ATP synthase membrane subunit c/vacuolar-type H+-ATPase subunit K